MNIYRVETVGMLCYGLDVYYCVQDYADLLGIDYPLDIPQKELWKIIQDKGYEDEIVFTNLKDTSAWFCNTIDEFFKDTDLLKPWMETEDLMNKIVPHVDNETVLKAVRKHISKKLKALKPNIKPRDNSMNKEEKRRELHDLVDKMIDAMIEHDEVYDAIDDWESKDWKRLDILNKDRADAYKELDKAIWQVFKRC